VDLVIEEKEEEKGRDHFFIYKEMERLQRWKAIAAKTTIFKPNLASAKRRVKPISDTIDDEEDDINVTLEDIMRMRRSCYAEHCNNSTQQTCGHCDVGFCFGCLPDHYCPVSDCGCSECQGWSDDGIYTPCLCL
jgi:hypothetical protein